MKNLVRILIVLTAILVIGFSLNLFSSNNEDLLVDQQPNQEEDEQLNVESKSTIKESKRPEEGVSTLIGKKVDNLQKKYGKPDRIDRSLYGYHWWIYSETEKYMQVGVKNNEIVTVAVVGNEINASPFKIGQRLEGVYQQMNMQPEVELETETGVYRFELFEDDLNIRPLIPLGDIFAQLYFDKFTGDLLFIRFMDKETLLELRPYDMTYRGELAEPPPLTEEERVEAETDTEQQIFELTNIIRQRYELSQLGWDGETAQVAKLHSQDMFESETFSHKSEKFGDLADRFQARGIFYESAGENIAFQYSDSIAVVAGWLNSKGHRETFLNEEFTHIGVGVYQKYYTQNFLKKSWE